MRAVTRAAAALAAAALGASPLGAAGAAERGARAAYGPEPRVALGAAEQRALRLARPRLTREGALPHLSGALVLAARELAAGAARGERDPISRRRVRAALARALAFDAAPATVLASAEPGSVVAALARSLPRSSATHVGVGVVERHGTSFAVLLLSDRKLTLAPFPREVAPGTRAVLRGTLGPGLARPRVFVKLPSGRVAETSVSGERSFHAPILIPEPGRHVVEVVAEGEGGPEVAALLTVLAGGARLEEGSATARPAAPEAADPREAEAAVVRTVNATRRRHGLAPVVAAADLSAVARRHSEAMAASGRVAHVLPGSREVGERLRSAGIAYRRTYENVARAATALEAHEAAEESPAHLGNVLRPQVSLVGVGIARARLPSGDPIVYLTEIFVELPEGAGDSRLTPDARVREAIWRERARLALPPLTADVALDALAREAASSMRDRDDPDGGGLARRALSLGRKTAAVDVFVASAPDEAIRSANLRDVRFGRVGVGLATGDSRRYGRGRLWIAVVYTD